MKGNSKKLRLAAPGSAGQVGDEGNFSLCITLYQIWTYMDMEPICTRLSLLTGSTSAPKLKRGPSCGLSLAKAIEIGKGPVPVVWTEETNTPVGPGSSLWSGEVSKLQLQVAPKTATSWRKIIEDDKMHMRSLVLGFDE